MKIHMIPQGILGVADPEGHLKDSVTMVGRWLFSWQKRVR